VESSSADDVVTLVSGRNAGSTGGTPEDGADDVDTRQARYCASQLTSEVRLRLADQQRAGTAAEDDRAKWPDAAAFAPLAGKLLDACDELCHLGVAVDR
jgi:hypothetical protein